MSAIVKIRKLEDSVGDLPAYETEGSAGMDVRAHLPQAAMEIVPGAVAMVPTGLAIALPRGYECQVRSRSGLAARHGIFALNAPGTVDSDYRGEIKVILANFGQTGFTINNGDRIAQLVAAAYGRVEWQPTDSLDETERGAGGFGSTGI